MFTTTIEWHDASVELPTESGEYFVCTDNGMVMNLPFSQKYKTFNVWDYYSEDFARAHAITARYWADKLVSPKNESEAE